VPSAHLGIIAQWKTFASGRLGRWWPAQRWAERRESYVLCRERNIKDRERWETEEQLGEKVGRTTKMKQRRYSKKGKNGDKERRIRKKWDGFMVGNNQEKKEKESKTEGERRWIRRKIRGGK
jgi:hypothetical protein